MSLASLAQPKQTVSTGSGLAGLARRTPSRKNDLSTTEGLAAKAQEVGLGSEANAITNPTPKLGFLGRVGKALGAFNPAEAILTGTEKGLGAGLIEYPKRIIQGEASAITGNDYGGTQRSFSDIADKIGIHNGIAKFGIGFVGDVLLDPTTYFGGAIAKGVLGATKATTEVGLKGLAKVAPEAADGLRMTGTGLQDAIGRAFQYGYKATTGATTDVLSFLSKKQQARIGLAASNLDRLGTGVLSPSQREELALKLIAGKRAEFTAREVGKTVEDAGKAGLDVAKSTDPLVQKSIDEQLARSQKLGAGVSESPYEVYFPFLKNDKVQKFLTDTKTIQVGSEGYRKQFKNLLTNDNIELDPAKAFFTRESQIVTDRMTRGFLSGFVGKYGKPLDFFKNEDEAAKAGHYLIREKGNFGKPLGYVGQYDAKLIRDSIDPGFQTVNMLAKATGFDAITSLFKRSVTGLFAPFHIRNFASGVIQNFETLGADALNPRNIAIGQKVAYLMGKGEKLPSGAIKLGGKTMKFSQVMKPFVDRFSGDTFYNADFEYALKKGAELQSVAATFSKERLKTTAKTLGLGQEGIPFKVGRAVGQHIEHGQKATAYITALGQGKSVKEALQIAENAGFDYRALTGFESQIMRRIIPFYSFTRKNLGLQLRTLGENPQRINQVMAFFSNVASAGGLTDEQKAALPEYFRQQFNISFGNDKNGNPVVAGGLGTPLEQPGQSLIGTSIPDSVRRIATSLNPLIKTPMETAFGKDFFSDRPINEMVDAKQYQVLPDYLKQFIDFREVKKDVFEKNKYGKLVKTGTKTTYTADPEKLHILRNLPTTRLFGYLYDIYRPDTSTGGKALAALTSVKPRPVDLATEAYFRDKDKQDELTALLMRVGVLRQFTKTYEPNK